MDCSYCKFTKAQSKCGQCQQAAYCGEDCQRKHWVDGHQDICRVGLRVNRADEVGPAVDDPETVGIECNDGKRFRIPKSEAEFIQEVNDKMLLYGTENYIRLPNMSSDVFVAILRRMNYELVPNAYYVNALRTVNDPELVTKYQTLISTIILNPSTEWYDNVTHLTKQNLENLLYFFPSYNDFITFYWKLPNNIKEQHIKLFNTVQILLKKRNNVNFKQEREWAPLLATAMNNEFIIDYFLSDPHSAIYLGNSFVLACFSGNVDRVEKYYTLGVYNKESLWNGFMFAIAKKRVDVCAYMLKTVFSDVVLPLKELLQMTREHETLFKMLLQRPEVDALSQKEKRGICFALIASGDVVTLSYFIKALKEPIDLSYILQPLYERIITLPNAIEILQLLTNLPQEYNFNAFSHDNMLFKLAEKLERPDVIKYLRDLQNQHLFDKIVVRKADIDKFPPRKGIIVEPEAKQSKPPLIIKIRRPKPKSGSAVYVDEKGNKRAFVLNQWYAGQTNGIFIATYVTFAPITRKWSFYAREIASLQDIPKDPPPSDEWVYESPVYAFLTVYRQALEERNKLFKPPADVFTKFPQQKTPEYPKEFLTFEKDTWETVLYKHDRRTKRRYILNKWFVTETNGIFIATYVMLFNDKLVFYAQHIASRNDVPRGSPNAFTKRSSDPETAFIVVYRNALKDCQRCSEHTYTETGDILSKYPEEHYIYEDEFEDNYEPEPLLVQFERAIINGNYRVVKSIIERDNVKPFAEHLRLAVVNDHPAIVRLLAVNGAKHDNDMINFSITHDFFDVYTELMRVADSVMTTKEANALGKIIDNVFKNDVPSWNRYVEKLKEIKKARAEKRKKVGQVLLDKE